jgi:phosphonate transport system substrate-binding protein
LGLLYFLAVGKMKKTSATGLLLLLSIFLASECWATAEEPRKVLFGLCPKYNPRLMYQYFQPMVDHLSKDSRFRFEIKLSKTYGETVKNLGKGIVDLGSCGPVPYIDAHEKYGVFPLLRGLTREGKDFYRSIIFTRKDSAIEQISGLRSHSFAFGQKRSTAGFIMPLYYLASDGICLKDLSRYSHLRHHDLVAKAVLRGEYDGGAAKDIVAKRYGDSLKFLLVSDPIPTVPFVASPRTPREVIDHVLKRLLSLNPHNEQDQRVMKKWDEEFRYGFTRAHDSDYDPIRKILRDPKGRCGRSN